MVKTAEELALMRVSGRLLAQVFEMLDGVSLSGMSTLAINDLVERYITHDLSARPASKGQYGFAYVLNSSINQVVCHGVPNAGDVVKDGDIVNLDITLEKNGFITDSSKTYMVGDVSGAARRLVRVTQEAMWKGIAAVRPGGRVGDIGFAIEKHAKKHGYSVVRDYCGHGIGREMHEEPSVLNFGRPGTGAVLRRFAPTFGRRVGPPLVAGAGIVLVVGALALLAVNYDTLLEVRWRGVAALAAFMVVALAIGHLFGGPDPDRRTGLAVACALRHIGVAVLVATSLPGPKTATILAVYVATSTAVSVPYVAWRRRRANRRA